MAEALNVMLVLVGSMIKEPLTGPLASPTKVTLRTGLAAVPPQRVTFSGMNGLLNVAVKPVAVGVKAVTTKPRVVMALLVPVMVGFVEVISVAVILWLPPVLSVVLNVCTPLSLPAPDVKV